jgi:DNA mismatch repair protein MutS
MQKQYNDLKAQHPDAVMLFRMGDFYEAFDDDAVELSKILGITLTSRGKDANRQPMAGIPHHALANYLPKLVDAGIKIAIADQMHEPVAGQLVERQIREVITPGVVVDEALLGQQGNNYLASVAVGAGKSSNTNNGNYRSAICLVDASTSAALLFEVVDDSQSLDQLLSELQKYQVKELVIADNLATWMLTRLSKQNLPTVRLINTVPAADFDLKESFSELKSAYDLNSLKAWGLSEQSDLLGPLNAARRYLQDNLHKNLNLDKLVILKPSSYVNIPWSSYRSLEVFADSTGSENYSLFKHLDNTITRGGRRLLKDYLLNVCADLSEIERRNKQVGQFIALFTGGNAVTRVKTALKDQFDYDRFLTKAAYQRLGPQDLYQLSRSIKAAKDLQSLVQGKVNSDLAEFDFSGLEELAGTYEQAITPGVLSTSDPGFINSEYDSKLQEILAAGRNGQEYIQSLEKSEVEKTGISSLKVRYNKVFGYYIEVSKSYASKVPLSYVRKQTLVNAERYITEDLKKWEEIILSNNDIRLKRELEILQELKLLLVPHLSKLSKLGRLIAEADVLQGFASLSMKYGYVKPEFGKQTELIALKHPVVAAALGQSFVANDLSMSPSERFLVITGPNMAGKSTYIRSVALAQIMAQIGCYVAAQTAKLPLTDGIYTRIGAADNLAQNESTFMVEMVEMSYIMRRATSNSLVILDEVGRGTSTYDGVALAWALVERISQNLKCRTLFATHYHELTELSKGLEGVVDYFVEAKAREKLYFTHKLKRGKANKSYGVEVARLAGLPEEIILRAREVLSVLEAENDIKNIAKTRLNYQQLGLPLSGEALGAASLNADADTDESDNIDEDRIEQLEIKAQQLEQFKDKLKSIDLNQTTPIAAITQLSELKQILLSKE